MHTMQCQYAMLSGILYQLRAISETNPLVPTAKQIFSVVRKEQL